MLPAFDRLMIRRIRLTITLYCRQLMTRQALVNQQRLAVYLEQHLTPADWLFWQGLSLDDRTALNLEAQPILQRQQFERVFKRYKRAGHERAQGWYQAVSQSSDTRI
ncbi:hypothetical protein [Spirosoma fluviale]|uniref:Uncharacterized protein n=1 Tax=Spirosoma fluviale TaxID=1597977 RepID=A0A286G5W8_9BACT|nr:hypothetical protein [Spirosoma fluviale]SOD90529.1 hypothetical protein SAMN06269250_3451 [Spirosoma fluviale]